MARKSRYDQLVDDITRALRPAPLGPPPLSPMPKELTASVYNANWTKAFEEDITDIHPNGAWKDEWKGTVVNSFGRNGRTVQVSYNPFRQCWEY